MNFYIKSIKLWFKTDIPPVEYEFHLNKVNVITGDSSTGKSSLLSIIDYCLLSGESNIVEDVINENVSMYGMSFVIRDTDYVIIRKNPKNGGDRDIFFAESNVYPMFFEANVGRGELIVRFNEMFNSPERCFNIFDRKVYTTFRNFLPVNYLTEDAIATQNTFFDTKFFKDPDIEAIISETTKIFIGIDESKKQELEDLCSELSVKLEEEDKRRDRVRKNVGEYNENLQKLFKVAVELGVCEATNQPYDTKLIINEIEKALKLYDKLFNSKEQLQIKKLKQERAVIKRELVKCKSLKDDIKHYNEYIEQVEDSLLPIEFISKHLDDVIYYEDTRRLIDNLRTTLEETKCQGRRKKQIPSDLLDQIDAYEQAYEKITKEIRNQDNIASKAMDVDWLFRLIQLKHNYEKISKPHSTIMNHADYIDLQQDLDNTRYQLNQLVTNKDDKLSSLNGVIKEYFGVAHGLSDTYKSCYPRFDLAHQALYLKRENEDSLITNVGSKCNYMFMHLCTFLGIHEHAIKENLVYIPSFLFVDQPSIPFYADKTEGEIDDNDDKKRLGFAFNLINIFMERITNSIYKRPFQIILVEHADSSYWDGKYPFFETRYEFVKGKDSGLIPDVVYHRL